MCQQYNLTPFSLLSPLSPVAANENGHPDFDPARWLARWKAAGGGWAGPHLLPLAGDPVALNALARELTDEWREALGEYLSSPIAE